MSLFKVEKVRGLELRVISFNVLRNVCLLIKTNESVICPLCC